MELIRTYFKPGLIALFTCISWINVIHAQKLVLVESSTGVVLERSNDSLISIQGLFKQWQSEQINSGYLACALDSVRTKPAGKQTIAYCFKGPKYELGIATIENIPPSVSFKRERNGTIKREQLIDLQNAILDELEENGYPFSTVWYEPLSVGQNSVSLQLQLDRGPLIVMDTLGIRGDCDISKNYLYNYLGFQPGEPYSESVVQSIDKRLRNLSLVKVTGPSRVYFIRDKALVLLYLDERKTDRVDGVVGLAPASENAGGDLLLTGEVHLDLNNLWQRGTEFSIDWRNFLEGSQELKVASAVPYILNTRLGVEAGFELLKFDTLYLNTFSEIGIRLNGSGNQDLTVFYQRRNTSLIEVDTSRIRQTGRLPATNAVRTDYYGLAGRMNFLDQLINPRKGVLLSARTSLGVRQITRDSRIDAVQFKGPTDNLISVYDTMRLRNLQGLIDAEIKWFIPVLKRQTLLLNLRSFTLLNRVVFFNELMQTGGNQSLRGFDEQSLFASNYQQMTIEFRHLLDEMSYAGIFFNAAYLENKSQEWEGNRYDWPLGFGVTGSLNVGGSQLRIAYALGRRQGSSIQLSSAKIHIGIINYF
jgi:outer membrane protein assembly factor BamA